MELFILILFLVMTCLSVILFFKIWGACNNIRKIRIISESEFESSERLKIDGIVAKFGERSDKEKVVDRELVRQMLSAYRFHYSSDVMYDGLFFSGYCKEIANNVSKKHQNYEIPKKLKEAFDEPDASIKQILDII